MKPFIIGISGPSCAGKTRLAAALNEALAHQESTILWLDSYYRDLSHLTVAQRAAVNFDAPGAIEHELFLEHLEQLANGAPVNKPIYDFTLHARCSECERVTPAAFIIVEGLLALYWRQARDLMGLKIFIDAPDAVCLERRLRRDVAERGRTEESVRHQYRTTVQPMYAQCVAPTRAYADLALDGEQSTEHLLARVLDRLHLSTDPSPHQDGKT